MFSTLTLCASVLLLGAAPEDQRKAPAAQPKAPAAQTKAPANAQPAPQSQPQKKNEPELLPVEANLVSYTNTERTRYGLPAMAVDPELMKSARQHAAWMASTQNMVHTNQPVAENIAMGQRDSGEAVNCWMNSSGHRANILNWGHRRVGVGAYRTHSGTIFWCQQFRP